MSGVARREGVTGAEVMTLYGETMTRTGALFGIGLAAIVPFGIVRLIVTTRFLDPADFGRLAILFAIASVVTIFCGVGFLQGTMMATYGIADDAGEGDGADLVEVGERPELRSEERKRLLGTGFLIVLAMSTALCLVVALAGGVVVSVLFGGAWVAPVIWMSASAWAGGLWRMLHQVPRMERKARRWAALMWVRPALVVALTVAALAAGLGISGVLMATTAGTLIAALIAFLVSRRCFRFRPQRGDAGLIWEHGKHWVPLTIAVAIQTNVNILLLGLLASPASVGFYQVASRIAQFPTFFADGFITAWPAMERSPISHAAKDRKGTRQYSAAVFTLLALSTLGLLVAVSLFSDALIHIAAPAYESAASLIPVIAGTVAAHVAFRGTFRATSFPRRRYWFTFLHLVWIGPYALVALLLAPINPTYAVAIAQIVAGAIVTALYVGVDRRGPSPTPFQWGRLGTVLLIAVACVGLVHLVPGGILHAVVSFAALLAFPLMILASGAVSKQQVAVVRSIGSAVLPRRASKREARRRLGDLPTAQREALQLLLCEQREPAAAAAVAGVARSVLLARMVRGLRRFVGAQGATPVDHLIGEYVLHSGTTIDRDALAASLRGQGIESLELHLLDEASGRVRRISHA